MTVKVACGKSSSASTTTITGERWNPRAPAQHQGVPQAATRRLCHAPGSASAIVSCTWWERKDNNTKRNTTTMTTSPCWSNLSTDSALRYCEDFTVKSWIECLGMLLFGFMKRLVCRCSKAMNWSSWTGPCEVPWVSGKRCNSGRCKLLLQGTH